MPAKYKHFRTIWANIAETSPAVSLSSRGLWWSSMHGVATCWRKDLPIRSISQCTFGMTFHVKAPRGDLFQRIIFFRLIFFVSLPCPCEFFLSNSVLDWTAKASTFASLYVQPAYTWSINGVGSSRSIFFLGEFSTCVFCFFPTIFLSSTWTDKNNPSFLCARKDISVGTFFPIPFRKALLRIVFPEEDRLMGDQKSSFQEERWGRQSYRNFLAVVVEGSWANSQDIRLLAIVTIWESRGPRIFCFASLCVAFFGSHHHHLAGGFSRMLSMWS